MRFRIAGLAFLTVIAACSDSSGPGSSGSTTVAYAGTFGSATHSGTIRFGTPPATIREEGPAIRASAAPIDLVGTMVFSDNSILDLTGTLDGASLTLAATGYAFTGTLSNGVISGTFTGPGGESGNFSASLSSTDATVKLYCGEFGGSDAGVFSLALRPDRSGGVIVVPSTGSGGLTGRSRAKSGTSNQIEVLPDEAPTFVIATGTLAPIAGTAFDSVYGGWNDGNGNSGTFGGSTRCQ